MIVELNDENTIVIKPESTAELLALGRFAGAKVTLEKAGWFQPNVDSLKLERKPEA